MEDTSASDKWLEKLDAERSREANDGSLPTKYLDILAGMSPLLLWAIGSNTFGSLCVCALFIWLLRSDVQAREGRRRLAEMTYLLCEEVKKSNKNFPALISSLESIHEKRRDLLPGEKDPIFGIARLLSEQE